MNGGDQPHRHRTKAHFSTDAAAADVGKNASEERHGFFKDVVLIKHQLGFVCFVFQRKMG